MHTDALEIIVTNKVQKLIPPTNEINREFQKLMVVMCEFRLKLRFVLF